MQQSVDTLALEQARLAALDRTGLLDTPPEQLFDLITALAAKALDVPVVLMSLVDESRQFFKSQCGLPSPWAERRETPLTHSFCQYVSMLGEALVVEDARAHPLVRDNLAVKEVGVIAYAGMPLKTEDGFTLGSLCAIDTRPRQWTTVELDILRGMADQMMAEISYRMRVNRLSSDLGAIRESEAGRRTQIRHIVHDLRTPLNALCLGLEGLDAMGELNKEQRACLELASKNAAALRDHIQRLIQIGAEEIEKAEQRTTCSLLDLMNRAFDQVAALAENAGVRLERPTFASLPPVVVHATEITRVLVNLISNGVKFTPRGGRVLAHVTKQVEGDLNVLRVSVSDSGIGISATDQKRIFREGVRIDRKADPRTSTGIGLAFCRRVIEDHGGQLTVESTPGQGSTFSFALPVVVEIA